MTLLLRSKEGVRKIEVALSVHAKDKLVIGGVNEKDFEEKWPVMKDAALLLAAGDKSVGKLFLQEAIEAYGAKEKLRPDQIVEAMAGAFLIERVSEL